MRHTTNKAEKQMIHELGLKEEKVSIKREANNKGKSKTCKIIKRKVKVLK